MAVTGIYTSRDLIESAYRKIGVVASDEPMTADQGREGLNALNRMLKGWQNKGFQLWTVTAMSVTLTTAATYTLTVRPLDILNCRFRRSGIDLPMQRMTRDDYDALPQKLSTGIPTTFYFNRQRDSATITVWPVLAAAAGQTLEISYNREFEDATDLDAETDVPGEWWDAVVYGLADRLSDDHQVNMPKVTARAERELRDALAFDREGSVNFYGYD